MEVVFDYLIEMHGLYLILFRFKISLKNYFMFNKLCNLNFHFLLRDVGEVTVKGCEVSF